MPLPKFNAPLRSAALVCLLTLSSIATFSSQSIAEEVAAPEAEAVQPALPGDAPEQSQVETIKAPATAPAEQSAAAGGTLSEGAQVNPNEPKPSEDVYDFENEEAYMDVPDALRSKQFVHRAILSTIIRDTAKVQLGGLYANYLMGFNAVYHPSNRGAGAFAKYASGLIGVSIGYATAGGHSAEVGFELSSVSTLMVSYRYIMRPENFSVWPFLGMGMGSEVSSLRLSDIPLEATLYDGSTSNFFGVIGAIVPLVDIAVKAEARFNFFGLDRLMLSTSLGAIFFI